MPNDFIMTNDTSNNRWNLTYSVDASGTKIKTLKTGGTFVDRDIKIAVTTAAGSTTVSGGTLSTTSSYSGTPTVGIVIDSQTTSGIGITDTVQTNGYYVKLIGSSSALSGTTTAKRTAVQLACTAGYIPGQPATTVTNLEETTVSPSVTIGAGNKTRYLTLPTATFSSSGGSVYANTAGWVPQGDATNTIISLGSGTITPGINNTNLSTYFNAGNNSNYSIVLQPTYTNTAGYIIAHTTDQIGTSSYYTIKTTTRTAGTGSVTLTAGAGNVTLTVGTGDSGSSSATSMSMATTAPSSGVYYTLTAKGKGTVSGTGKGTVSTGTGWITSGSTTSNDSTSTSQTSHEATTYGYIIKSVHGSVEPGVPTGLTGRTTGTYQDIEIQPYTYLLIPKGYNPLDRYIYSEKADDAGEAIAASNYTLNVSSVSGSNNVSVGTKNNNYYPIIANNLSITATLTAQNPGWFSAGSETDSDTDNVTVGQMVEAQITASCSSATASTTVNPGTVTILTNNTAVSGKTRLALIPTTDNTSISTYYIAITASAAANTTGATSSISGTATASVTTAGYAPSTLTGSGNVTGTATAVTSQADSDVYYIPVPTATLTFSGGDLGNKGASATFINSNNKVITTAITDDYNNGLLVETTGTASRGAVTYINTEGYIPENTVAVSASSATSTTSWSGDSYYLKGVKIAAPATGTAMFDITVPNGNTTDFITFQFQVDASGNVYVMGPNS